MKMPGVLKARKRPCNQEVPHKFKLIFVPVLSFLMISIALLTSASARETWEWANESRWKQTGDEGFRQISREITTSDTVGIVLLHGGVDFTEYLSRELYWKVGTLNPSMISDSIMQVDEYTNDYKIVSASLAASQIMFILKARVLDDALIHLVRNASASLGVQAAAALLWSPDYRDEAEAYLYDMVSRSIKIRERISPDRVRALRAVSALMEARGDTYGWDLVVASAISSGSGVELSETVRAISVAIRHGSLLDGLPFLVIAQSARRLAREGASGLGAETGFAQAAPESFRRQG